jgi:hypothetical protein
MNPHNKASHQQRVESGQQQQHTASNGAHEFADADDMLRYDASTTEVPPKIEQRIQRTLGPAQAPWWKRLLGL